jgi:hypothetical protein
MHLILDIEIMRNFGTSMKNSTWPLREQGGFGCFQQIVAHLGGMTRARLRHRLIHFAFHWRGICRAIRPKLDFLGLVRELHQYVNKNRVPSTKAAGANVGQEFWRTVEAFRRIRGGMDTEK